MTPAQAHGFRPTSREIQNPALPPSPHEALTHIAPLLSGLSFLATHGYHRRGMELSLSCRLPSPRGSVMTLHVYPETKRSFDLAGISFRVEVEGDERATRIATLNAQGTARIEGIGRTDRVRLTLDVTK